MIGKMTRKTSYTNWLCFLFHYIYIIIIKVDSDFLLIILRQVLKERKDLKIVLMSATINQQVFAGKPKKIYI